METEEVTGRTKDSLRQVRTVRAHPKGPRRDPEKEKCWRRRMSEASASGVSVREFCRKHGLNENLFYAWRRELKARDAAGKPRSGFVELLARDGCLGASGISIRVDDRLSVVVERGFDGETLRATLAVAREVARL